MTEVEGLEGNENDYEIAEKNLMRNTFMPPVNEAKLMKYKSIGLLRGAHGEIMKIISNTKS